MNLRQYAAKQKQLPANKGKPDSPGHDEGKKEAAPQLPDKCRRAYRIAFNFQAKHTPAPRTVEGWIATAREAATISIENGNDPFLMELLIAAYNELQREAKEGG